MKLILGAGKTAQSIACFLDKQSIEFTLIKDTRVVKDESALQSIDEIFISPGIAQTELIVIWAKAKKIPITSDIELFSRYSKAPIIGITGSNGKSTVTQLLGEMIANDGKKVAIGGNIGTPALDCLNDEIEYYVLELSSYQLDYTQNLTLLTGVVLNITPDHLDRYPSFNDYAQSKLSLYKYCKHPIVNIDEPLIPTQPSAKYFGINMPKTSADFGTVTCHESCYILKGDDSLIYIGDMPLIGEHNLKNALAALTLGDQIGLSIDAMTHTLKTFKGLEHRLEWVTKKDNITYYNDSKATNSTSTITAIQALIPTNQNIILIMGGIKKQEDYHPLFTLINQHIKSTILIGQDTQQFEKELTNTTQAKTLPDAIHIAQSMIMNGIILLSPACASFDMFEDFEQRGRVFKDTVRL
ncbi:MAG: UDP-N-acetylmuramoylalanine--D-glutamate ligase [Catillopecten margaritatus gill symbiont]|uniref:UDP-N-acetylmuramoylalanine--D-glutamate ligase n=1 Tax=Catillopecten margaritatus gill symbiont TaxID=3083288 RepID=A0AAU6PF78_9GAMM